MTALAQTDTALQARLDEFGITRLADTTGLDRVKIPTYAAICPGTRDTIWVYSGKGATPARARISAIMECVERTSVLWDDARVFVATASEARERAEVWGPERFTEATTGLDATSSIAWCEVTNLRTQRPVLVPAELVFTGARPRHLLAPAFAGSTTNGLGAGLHHEQALAQALGEVIERDTVSCAELRASHYGASILRRLAALLSVDETPLFEGFRDDVDFAPTIDPASLPSRAGALYQRFADADLQVCIKYIPNDFGLPVFGASACEHLGFDAVLGAAGYGLACDREDAVCAALLELAQSRATDRQGAREDCGHDEKRRLTSLPASHWLATPSPRTIAFKDLPASPTTPLSSETYLSRLTTAGLHDAAVATFPSYPGIHVVRVLVPEAETWHATQGRSRIGVRMRRALVPGS